MHKSISALLLLSLCGVASAHGPLFVSRATDHWSFLSSYLVGVNDRGGSNFDELTVIIEFEF